MQGMRGQAAKVGIEEGHELVSRFFVAVSSDAATWLDSVSYPQ
jgi:hypothetical protein